MKTATRTISINPAFLHEIKADNRELHGLLLQIRLARATRLSRCAWRRLVGLFGRLRDNLAMYFAVEETFGYFDDPLCVEPCLSRRVESVRAEHPPLYTALCHIVDEAEDLLHGERRSCGPRVVLRRFRAFRRKLLHHEAREERLIHRWLPGAAPVRKPR